MRVLIAGCGDVGGALARVLLASGDSVIGLRRNARALPDGVEPIAADLSRPEALRDLPDDLDAVVYSAGPAGGGEAAYRSAYVEGQRNLIEALLRSAGRPRRWLFCSSTAVYGQSSGEWVDEDSPTEPAGPSGRILLEAESIAARGAPEACAVRFGGIYGPGRTRLIDSVRSGAARLRPGPPHFTNRIHRDDAAAALACLLRAEPLQPRVLAVDGSPADDNEVLCYVARLLGLPDPPEAEEGEPLPPRRAGSKRCRNARLVSAGFHARFPSYREGYAALASG